MTDRNDTSDARRLTDAARQHAQDSVQSVLAERFPCTETHKARGLEQPGCAYHDAQDTADALVESLFDVLFDAVTRPIDPSAPAAAEPTSGRPADEYGRPLFVASLRVLPARPGGAVRNPTPYDKAIRAPGDEVARRRAGLTRTDR